MYREKFPAYKFAESLIRICLDDLSTLETFGYIALPFFLAYLLSRVTSIFVHILRATFILEFSFTDTKYFGKQLIYTIYTFSCKTKN